MSRDLFRLKNKTLKTLKIFIINALFSNYIMLGQDWASMSYIVNDDDNMVMMISLIVSVIVLIASLLVDVLIAIFDPRIKLQ